MVYADYQPSLDKAEMIDRAFSDSENLGTNLVLNGAKVNQTQDNETYLNSDI